MSKRKLVIFGHGDIAQLAHYYFSTDTDFEIVAFTVDSEYVDRTTVCDLPLVPFDRITETYPAEYFQLFIALSYSRLNIIRKEKYERAKSLGYTLASYISSRATVLNDQRIGDNCFILENNTIQPFVTIGNNVTLWSGSIICHHSTINDHVFIASHVAVSGHCNIGEQCFIGVNATIRDNISIGDHCIIGAGSLILSDADAEGLYRGAETGRADRSSLTQKRI